MVTCWACVVGMFGTGKLLGRRASCILACCLLLIASIWLWMLAVWLGFGDQVVFGLWSSWGLQNAEIGGSRCTELVSAVLVTSIGVGEIVGGGLASSISWSSCRSSLASVVVVWVFSDEFSVGGGVVGFISMYPTSELGGFSGSFSSWLLWGRGLVTGGVSVILSVLMLICLTFLFFTRIVMMGLSSSPVLRTISKGFSFTCCGSGSL